MATTTRPTPSETRDAEPQETNDVSATSGRGWHGDPEGHASAGRKGGQTVSQNREHMAAIGRRGGQAVSRDRQHMASIGRKGGQARNDHDKNESSAAANSDNE